MTDLTTVEKKLDDAMRAQEEFKGTITKKLDGFDTEKLDKLAKDMGDGIEQSQKLRLAVEAETKARGELETSLKVQIDEALKSGAEATGKQIADIEKALERLSLTGGVKDATQELQKKWNSAFNAFARKENPNGVFFADALKGDAEHKDLSVGSNADGGYLVMPVFGAMVSKRVFESSPIRSLASSMTISTDAIEFPTDNDEAASGGWVGEVSARTTTGTPQITEQRIPVFEQYANPRMTQKLLDDAAFDPENWLQGKVADKFLRLENTAFVSGAGSKSPRGLLTYGNYTQPGVATFESAKIEQVASGVSGGVGYDGLINLQNLLLDVYQGNAKFLMARQTYGVLLKIKDGESRPIFNLTYDKNAGIAANILGKEVVFASDMPAVAANALAIAYGDFREGYLVVDRTGIRILRDPYTAKPYIQFYTTKRVGGDITNFQAIKLLAINP